MLKRKFEIIKTLDDIKDLWDLKGNGFELTEKLSTNKLFKFIHKSPECECYHQWESTIYRMLTAATNGCSQCYKSSKCIPCCEGRSLQGNKNLMDTWDFGKNVDINPRNIFNNNRKEYYWKCKNTCKDNDDCKHEWFTSVYQRNMYTCQYCAIPSHLKNPCCNNRSARGNENLMKYWDFEKNDKDKIFPENYRPHVNVKVWFKCDKVCSENCFHSWQISINIFQNTAGNCPFCVHQRVCCILKSAAQVEFLVNTFDKNRNFGISLEKLNTYSNQKLWWICTNTCKDQDDCHHQWFCSVHARKSKCPYCTSQSKIPCCIKKSCANKKYTDTMKDFDFNANGPLTLRDLFPASMKILNWKCQFCEFKWKSNVDHRTKRKSIGCLNCSLGTSYGERECKEVLTKLCIPFEKEFVIPIKGNRKRFDFQFVYNGRNYLLEFDGEQHFIEGKFYHPKPTDFLERQKIDVQKTIWGINSGYFVIRIDYMSEKHIEEHIKLALENDITKNIYVSNVKMYKYILDNLLEEEKRQ